MNKVANIYMTVCCEKQMKCMNFHSKLLAILLLVCESTSVLLLVETAKTMHIKGFLTNVQAIIIVAPPHLLVFCVIN